MKIFPFVFQVITAVWLRLLLDNIGILKYCLLQCCDVKHNGVNSNIACLKAGIWTGLAIRKESDGRSVAYV